MPPAAARARDPLPLLCFLHGRDEAAPLELRAGVTRHGPLRPGSWRGARDAFIVVAPQLRQPGDHWHRHADAVVALVAHVQRAYGGDPERTYLTGFSFGGNGVLDLAQREPSAWAALWPVDPTRLPAGEIALPLWLSVGDRARPLARACTSALGLETAGGEEPAGARLQLDEGEDHVGSAARAYADARIYRWLLRWRRAR